MKDVIVIGAGIAGISAALELAEKGFKVRVFETKFNPGGRVYSLRDNTTGEIIDNGQHIISGAYQNFLTIVKKLGTENLFKSQKALRVTYADRLGKKHTLDTGKLPGKAGLAFGFLKFDLLSLSSKYSVLRFILKLNLGIINAKDKNCLEFLKSEKQTNQAIEYFWTPLIISALNDKPENVSAKLLVNILVKAFFANNNYSKLILPTCDLSSILTPFESKMKSLGSDVHFNSKVNKIFIEDDKVKYVILNDSQRISADYYILALNPKSISKLFNLTKSNSYIEKLINFTQSLEYSAIINIYFWLDKHIQTEDFTALIGTNTHWVFNRRNFVCNGEEIIRKYPGMINLTISSAEHLLQIPSDELAQSCFNELISNMPEFAKANILHYKVIKDKFATFKATPEIEKNRPSGMTPIDNFYLAGDWINTGLPATIESAAFSGLDVACNITANTM